MERVGALVCVWLWLCGWWLDVCCVCCAAVHMWLCVYVAARARVCASTGTIAAACG